MIGRLRLQDLMESVRAEVPLGVDIEHEAGRGQERGRGGRETELSLASPGISEHLGQGSIFCHIKEAIKPLEL